MFGVAVGARASVLSSAPICFSPLFSLDYSFIPSVKFVDLMSQEFIFDPNISII